MDESVLWPETVRAAVKVGPERELVAFYPFRSGVPQALWRTLIGDARRVLTFAGYTNYFLWLEQANLASTLRRKAEQGARVRFLLGDRDSDVTRRREEVEAVPLTVSTRISVTLSELTKLADVPNVEVRFSDQHVSLSVFRFDDQMLVCQHIADRLGHDSPTMHLRRRQDDGIFDRFALHVDQLWQTGRPGDPD